METGIKRYNPDTLSGPFYSGPGHDPVVSILIYFSMVYKGIIEDRLPVPFEEYEKQDAEKAMKKADKVLLIVKDFLDYRF